jgi:ribosomal-protein-alanine N-acetyltransferase
VIDIHPLREEEVDLVVEAFPHRTPLQHRSRFDRQIRGDFTYLIAWEADTPVGHVGIDWPDDRELVTTLEGHDHPSVHDLAVLPPHRRRGIGRALMIELERRVRERGMRGIRLDTGLDEGYAAARSLYRSLGYMELPRSLHVESFRFPGGRVEDLYLEVLTVWEKRL